MGPVTEVVDAMEQRSSVVKPAPCAGYPSASRVPVGMTTTPPEPSPEPEVVPSGDPAPTSVPDPETEPQPGEDPGAPPENPAPR